MNRLFRTAVHVRGQPLWARMAAALLLVALGLAARIALLGPGPGYPYSAFTPPIILSAVLLGRRPGAMAVVLATALALGLFAPTRDVPWTDPRNLAAAAAFLGGGMTLVLLADAVFRAVTALTTVLDGIGEPFYALDAEQRVLHASRAALGLWRKPAAAVLGRRLMDVLPPGEGSAPLPAIEEVLRTRQARRIEAMSQVAGRWVEVDIFPAPDGGLSVAFRDIHDRRAAEQRQRVLLAEFAHRIKNTLALVLAIADQTRRAVASPEEFHAAFQQRLAALARAHDALLRDGKTETTLDAVLREALAPHLAETGRLELGGPAITVPPETAVALSMAFHELATNAAKHGALSVPGGRVRVTWRSTPEDAGEWLHALQWQEIGGPRVAGPPERRGFGTRLLQGVLGAQLHGSVSLDYAASGLCCEILFRTSDRPPAGAAPSPHSPG